MNEEQIKGTIRGFLKAITTRDVTQALSYVAKDAVWVTPQGTLKGEAEIKNYIVWINKIVKDYKITENGIGIITQGDTGIIEHNLSGVTNDKKWEVPAICIYEFKGDKIQNMRTFFDRASQAKQAAKGVFAKWAVNAVVNATEKGLR
jgi:ketosteroid isomerase-like protein